MDDGAPGTLGAREMAGTGALYLAFASWWLWPLPLHLASHSALTLHGRALEFEGADWYLIVWALAWGAHALVTNPLHLFDANTFHPAPRSLAFSEHFLGHQPLFAPLYLATGNAVLAVNVLLLAMFTCSALGFYALARRFVGKPAALVGGMLFSFCPWRHEGLLHLHLLGVQYLPLVLLFTERWLERARRRDAWFLAAALALQALSSVYLAFATAVLYVPYLALASWRWRSRLDRRRLMGLGLVLGAVAALIGSTSLPYVELARLGLIPSYGGEGQGPALGANFANRDVLEYLTATGIGRLGYVLVAVALLPPWYRRRWPIVVGVMALVVGVLIASGNRGLPLGDWRLPAPFPWLARLLPPVAAIRLPGRVVVVAHLGLCLLAALGVDRLTGRMRGGRAWGAGVLIAVALVACFPPLEAPTLRPVPVCPHAPEPYAWLAHHGEGRPLLELPAPAAPVVSARRMYLSTCHWLPVVDGYSAYPPRIAELVHDRARGLPQEEAFQDVVDTVDLGWIVVHGDEMPPSAARRWDGPLPAGLAEVARFGQARVLRVTRAPGIGDRRGRLFSTTKTLGDVPLAPLGATCPGRLELVGALPALRLGQKARFDLAVTNQGDAPWPGLGLIPRHLVHVRACVTPLGTSCSTPPQPLGADVPAGETRTLRVAVTVPPVVFGPQALRVELWQLGDGPLERCGTAPVTVAVPVVR